MALINPALEATKVKVGDIVWDFQASISAVSIVVFPTQCEHLGELYLRARNSWSCSNMEECMTVMDGVIDVFRKWIAVTSKFFKNHGDSVKIV